MTCIVAVKHDNVVWMGGDAAASNGYKISTYSASKVFKKQDMLFGYTTSFRMGQVIQHQLSIPKHHSDIETIDYLCTDFITSVYNSFKSHWQRKDTSEGGTFILGYKNRIFTIQSDWAVLEFDVDYAAVGCGESYAQGSLVTTVGQDPKTRIRQALDAADEHSTGVKGPYTIISEND